MKRTVQINGREIGDGCPPYVIAELSANHNGDIGRALQIIQAAKDAGRGDAGEELAVEPRIAGSVGFPTGAVVQ